MPTARELLEQADALMRRNRALADAEAAAARTAPDDDVPELTESVDAAPAAAPSAAASRAVASLDDVPELTDAVEEIEAPSILEPGADDELSRWLEIDRGEKSVTGPAPDSIVVVPAALRAAAPTDPIATPTPATEAIDAAIAGMSPVLAPLAAETGAPVVEPMAEFLVDDALPDEVVEIDIGVPGLAVEPERLATDGLPDDALSAAMLQQAAAPLPGAEDTRWAALAEDIRMQVLQRLDIFTDTGLQGELTTRLQPIVDRASADLVAAINQHVGQILRSYVAEAIEREIEKWRQGG